MQMSDTEYKQNTIPFDYRDPKTIPPWGRSQPIGQVIYNTEQNQPGGGMGGVGGRNFAQHTYLCRVRV